VLNNKETLIRACYTYSQELGKEVTALANGGAGSAGLERLREIVYREFADHEAELAYETIVAALSEDS